jgi:hypothetical protein
LDVPATLYEFTAATRTPQADVDGFRQRVEQHVLSDPLTFYGAGPQPDDFRKQIQAACDGATGGKRE